MEYRKPKRPPDGLTHGWGPWHEPRRDFRTPGDVSPEARGPMVPIYRPRNRPRKSLIFPFTVTTALLTVTILAFAPVAFGRQDPPELPQNFSEPMPLYTKALGSFSRPISSSNPEAQAYFDQGFQMMYAFAKQDATRSFREAARLDPDCAVCFWGEAWTWGSYLNGPMLPRESPHAYAAIQRALELAPGPRVRNRTGIHRCHGGPIRARLRC